MEKIVQIIPAPNNLYARYKETDGEQFLDKVVCLALIEDEDGYRYVAPMIVMDESITDVGGISNFQDIVFK